MSSIACFTPSTMSAARLERLFTVRGPVLGSLMRRVAALGNTPSPHHTLLVGPRGAGKTHLISLVYHRSQALVDAGSHLQTAWLPEDPWAIVSYQHLLTAVLNITAPRRRWRGTDEAELLSVLTASTQEHGPLLLLMENVDQVLRQIGPEGQQKLRHLLQTRSDVLVIGGTTRLDRNFSDQDQPLFGFFDTITLRPFTPEQAREMLTALARENHDEVLAERLGSDTALARLRTVTHLAGGQPRLWALLGSSLTAEGLDALGPLLLSRCDDLTPYYQEQLAHLPGQQRLVVAELASADRPLSVKDLAGAVGQDQRSVAKTLSDLSSRGWVTPVETVFADLLDRRRTYYELTDPLARLVFQIKESRGRALRLAVEFLRNWFDPTELDGAYHTTHPTAHLSATGNQSTACSRYPARPSDPLPSGLLAQVEDALAAAAAGDAGPVMALPSTLRLAIEQRTGTERDLTPIRLGILDYALTRTKASSQPTESALWLSRARRLDAEVGDQRTRLMLVRWLAGTGNLEEARAGHPGPAPRP